MSDPARGLQYEGKSVGNLCRPVQQDLLGRHSVKCVVDLYRGETFRVKGEHTCRGKVLGIEVPLPFLVGVPACAGTHSHASRAARGCTSIPHTNLALR